MDKIGCDMICKNHSARSDRDQFRICPTKLSKQELEDLYFALVEDNLELKKTINGQQDRIKMLSTKMQRLSTTQKIFKPEGRRDCCANTKAVINQQKELIADLKHANERMSDRIRKLNMRLCSAKQFCKSVTPRCLRCSTATSPYLIKSLPQSQRQQSQSTLKLAASCHNLTRNDISNKYTQTEAFESTKYEKTSCEDNKCITIMDELKQKINNLQEELSHTNEEYTARVNVLQMELEENRNENVRVRSERVVIEQEMLQREQKTTTLITSLRAAEGLSNELKTQLSIEHRKVAELETRLKAATISNRVSESIENTLTSIQESVKSKNLDITISPSPRSILDSSAPQTFTEISSKTMNVSEETRLSKNTDDSGYIGDKYNDKSMDDESLNKIIEDLTNRISVLQTQVDHLTISPPQTEKVSDKSIVNDVISISYIKKDVSSNSLDESIDTTKKKVQVKDKYDSKNSDIEIQSTSPKTDQNNSVKVPAEIVANVVITNKNNKNDDDSEKNIKIKRKRNESNKDILNDCDIDRNIEKDINISATSDEKTYTVPNKDKNINDSEFKLKKDKENVVTPSLEKNSSKSKDVLEKPMIKDKSKKIIKHRSRPESSVRAKAEERNVESRGEATYTLNNDSSTSSDDTEYEISSMTDLSEDREPKRTQYVLSPGEQKYNSTQSESVNLTTDTTNYSLSEGEIPTTTVRRRSSGDISRGQNRSKQAVPKMEETLHAISEEIARCKRLMFSQRSRDYGMSALM